MSLISTIEALAGGPPRGTLGSAPRPEVLAQLTGTEPQPSTEVTKTLAGLIIRTESPTKTTNA